MVRDPVQLTCKEVVELVTELLGDDLPPEGRARLEQHLLVCPPCTLHVRQVTSTIALTAGLRAQAVPAPDIIELFRARKPRDPGDPA
jgi:anti-sigma factor RsiW